MQNIKKSIQIVLVILLSTLTFSFATPGVVSAETSKQPPACDTHILTFPTWYNGVVDDNCNVAITELVQFWVIVMNFIEILLQLVAYVSVGYIIWGGVKYIKSEGDPSKISEAKAAIMNAIIGLVIALASVAVVQFISGSIEV